MSARGTWASVMGALSGASMVAAAAAQRRLEAHGVEATFAACWLSLLVPMLGLAGLGRGGDGNAAIVWLGLVPLLGFVTRMAIDRPLTASWHYLCGSGALVIVLLPVVAWAFVAGTAALGALVGRRSGWLLASCGIAFGAWVLLRIAFSPPAPSATMRLATEVRTLAALPPLESLVDPVVVSGTKIVRTCAPRRSCAWSFDGVEATTLDETQPLELAEGLGHRFVRPVGSAPSAWLAYRRGDEYGDSLSARSFGGAVAAPPGIGRAAVATGVVALLYAIAAAVSAARIRALRRAHRAEVLAPGVLARGSVIASCDPSLAVGPATIFGALVDTATYRTRGVSRARAIAGDPSSLLLREWQSLRTHGVTAAVLLVLGATPAWVALSAGLVVSP